MFRTSMPGRTTRAIAAGALIFSLAATTLVGSANAAPLANNQACSAASQAHNDAAHALRDAWKASTSDLKTVASNAPTSKGELMSTWRDLKTVLMQAVQDLKDLGIGSACDEEATTPTDTSALAQQAKDIVDKAILDLQAIVNAARTAAADPAANAPTDSTTGSNDENDNASSDGPKDSTTGASDNNKDQQGENVNDDHQGQDQNVNEDQNDNSSEKSQIKTDVAKVTSLTKGTNATVTTVGKAKSKSGRSNSHSGERD